MISGLFDGRIVTHGHLILAALFAARSRSGRLPFQAFLDCEGNALTLWDHCLHSLLVSSSQRLVTFRILVSIPHGDVVSRPITNASASGRRETELPSLNHTPAMPLGFLSNVILLSPFVFEHVERRSHTSTNLCLFSLPSGKEFSSNDVFSRLPGCRVERIALPLKEVSFHPIVPDFFGENLLDIVFSFCVA